MNNFNDSKPTRLSKVYFTWVIRDFGSAEWFHSLLHAIEEQDTQNRIEINIYLTAKLKDDDMNNIIVRGSQIPNSRALLIPGLGSGRRGREGRDHFPKGPNAFRSAQLGPCVLILDRETPRCGCRRILLRPDCDFKGIAHQVQRVLDPQRNEVLLRKG